VFVCLCLRVVRVCVRLHMVRVRVTTASSLNSESQLHWTVSKLTSAALSSSVSFTGLISALCSSCSSRLSSSDGEAPPPLPPPPLPLTSAPTTSGTAETAAAVLSAAAGADDASSSAVPTAVCVCVMAAKPCTFARVSEAVCGDTASEALLPALPARACLRERLKYDKQSSDLDQIQCSRHVHIKQWWLPRGVLAHRRNHISVHH
jgi:hypothetical protein